jgi:hypothetical protein
VQEGLENPTYKLLSNEVNGDWRDAVTIGTLDTAQILLPDVDAKNNTGIERVLRVFYLSIMSEFALKADLMVIRPININGNSVKKIDNIRVLQCEKNNGLLWKIN